MFGKKISLQIINNKGRNQYASVEPEGYYIEIEDREFAAIELSAKRRDLVIIVQIIDTGVAFGTTKILKSLKLRKLTIQASS